MNLLFKKTILKIFHLASAKIIKTIDTRKNLQNVQVLEKPQLYAIGFSTIHTDRPDAYWLNFKHLNLDPLFYFKLEQARLVGTGIVINRTGQVVLESTIFQKEYFLKLGQNHLVIKSKFQHKPYINREVISLSNALEDNYFHWIMESITRMLLIDNTIDLSKALIVLNQSNLPFKKESLFFLFGIRPENILQKKVKEVFVCNTVVVPSFPHTRNAQTYMTDVANPTTLKLLNKRVSEKLLELKPEQPRHFFLSRRKSDSRRVLNEQHLLKMISHADLKIVETENMSFSDQVSLFFHAKLVIATHGAGLTNIVFCKDATILELFPKDRNIRDAFVFTQISSALKLQHHVISYSSSNEHQDVEMDLNLASKINEVIRSLTYS